jgi:hypothetical protein
MAHKIFTISAIQLSEATHNVYIASPKSMKNGEYRRTLEDIHEDAGYNAFWTMSAYAQRDCSAGQCELGRVFADALQYSCGPECHTVLIPAKMTTRATDNDSFTTVGQYDLPDRFAMPTGTALDVYTLTLSEMTALLEANVAYGLGTSSFLQSSRSLRQVVSHDGASATLDFAQYRAWADGCSGWKDIDSEQTFRVGIPSAFFNATTMDGEMHPSILAAITSSASYASKTTILEDAMQGMVSALRHLVEVG